MPLALNLSDVIAQPVSPVLGTSQAMAGLNAGGAAIEHGQEMMQHEADRASHEMLANADRASSDAYRHATVALDKAQLDEQKRQHDLEREHQRLLEGRLYHEKLMAAEGDPEKFTSLAAEAGQYGMSVSPTLEPTAAPPQAQGPSPSPTAVTARFNALPSKAAARPDVTGSDLEMPPAPPPAPPGHELDLSGVGQPAEPSQTVDINPFPEPISAPRPNPKYTLKGPHGEVLHEFDPHGVHERRMNELTAGIEGLRRAARPGEEGFYNFRPEDLAQLAAVAGSTKEALGVIQKHVEAEAQRRQTEINAQARADSQSTSGNVQTDFKVEQTRKDILEKVQARSNVAKLHEAQTKLSRAQAGMGTKTGPGDLTALFNEINVSTGGRFSVGVAREALHSAGYAGDFNTFVNKFKEGRQSPQMIGALGKLLSAMDETLTDELDRVGEEARHQIIINPTLRKYAPPAELQIMGQGAYDAVTGDVTPMDLPSSGPDAQGSGGSSERHSRKGKLADEVIGEIGNE
jgi:hypothetical protein